MPDKILVFIPCYNCAPQIRRVLRQFDGSTAGYFSELLVLDNGSRDDTLTAAVDAAREVQGAGITIGRNRGNYNLGGSHKVAFQYAVDNGFSHVAVLHGDDQGRILDLLPILTSGKHRLLDACLGARFMRGSKLSGYSRFRIFGNAVFNFLFSLRAAAPVKDLGSGLNIFGRRVIEDERVRHYANDLTFNIYLLLGLFDRKLRFEFFPISWREDDQISNVKMVSQALKTAGIAWRSLVDRKRLWSADPGAGEARGFDVVYRA